MKTDFKNLRVPMNRLQAALKASLLHLTITLFIAIACAALVFGLWYPGFYRNLSGGTELFVLVMAVDIVCGPLLTLVLFNPQKPRRELWRDLGLVGVIQLAALIYGLWSVSAARPVYLVFEADRFTIVSAAEVDSAALRDAQAEFQRLGYFGPRVIAARVPKGDEPDYLESVNLSLNGFGPALRPGHWRDFSSFRDIAIEKAKSIKELKKLNPGRIAEIDAVLKQTNLVETKIKYLPIQGRSSTFWVALIATDDARLLGYIPVDGL